MSLEAVLYRSRQGNGMLIRARCHLGSLETVLGVALDLSGVGRRSDMPAALERFLTLSSRSLLPTRRCAGPSSTSVLLAFKYFFRPFFLPVSVSAGTSAGGLFCSKYPQFQVSGCVLIIADDPKEIRRECALCKFHIP